MQQIGHHESGVRADRHVVVDPASFRNDLDNLLQTLQSELAELSKKRSDISRRIRLLDKTLRGLRAGVGQRSGTPLTGSGHNKASKSDGTVSVGSMLSQAANLNSADANSQDRRGSRVLLAQLQRACRIALAEAAGPASPQELYARIARRESFPLGNVEAAIAAIVQTLGAMQEDGEVRCMTESPQGSWESTGQQKSAIL